MSDCFFFGKCFVEKFPAPLVAPDQAACLFLHGFPSERGKNEDVAKAVSQNTGLDAFCLHYEGLGNSHGVFSFQKSLERSAWLAKWLHKEGYARIHLVGHSWGGFVALHVKKQLDALIHRVVLLAPFTDLPAPGTAHAPLQAILQEHPHLLAKMDIPALATELESFYSLCHPWNVARSLRLPASQCLIVQGVNDSVVPPSTTRRWVAALKEYPTYREVDHSHGFADREWLIAEVVNWLAKP